MDFTTSQNHEFPGILRCQSDCTPPALKNYEKALRIDPTLDGAKYVLATNLSCCPIAKFRDGKRAVALARELFIRSSVINSFKKALLLAAAYAECGQFDDAVLYAKQASTLGSNAIQREAAKQALECTSQGKPYRSEPVKQELRAIPQHLHDLSRIKEASSLPDIVFPRNEIVRICSKLISKREVFSKQDLCEIYQARGDAYASLGKVELAKKDYDRVLEISPDHPAYCKRLDLQLRHTKDYRVTEQKTLEYLRKHEKSPQALFLATKLLLLQGNQKAATEYATQGIATGTKDPTGLYLRASALYEQKQYEDALKDLNQLISEHPVTNSLPWHQPYLLRAKVLIKLKKTQQALGNLRLVKQLNVSPSEYLPVLHKLLVASGKHNLARYVAKQLE